MSDRIFGICGLLLAALFAYSAFLIEESFLSDAVGPKAFPLIIAAILAISSVFIIIKPDAEPKWPTLNRFAEIVAAIIAMVLYAEFLTVVGFVIATAVVSAYLTWRLGTSAISSLIVGVSISVGIYVIFHLLFGLSLAKGPLGF
ncbi:putative tricarboxylic transport membrane protein [Cohaesibacter sp. ES.047]|uniref:tripartite tricarboxylate transporter TctB family protein n=1 Tax=Cohaesibacter sp. ES.047 TaxID=1798205 RepID=UPI000BB967C6|nr:tripartite tricarboxylate transporter TctB family protein [Cohaesibacter sp. ES.047]SNY93192.1 putative tricarboxylic transport membrane protein [Cohaesibacter sp. ES.047]